jgi:hypothetical protein
MAASVSEVDRLDCDDLLPRPEPAGTDAEWNSGAVLGMITSLPVNQRQLKASVLAGYFERDRTVLVRWNEFSRCTRRENRNCLGLVSSRMQFGPNCTGRINRIEHGRADPSPVDCMQGYTTN